jgi:osmoprotectant transport system substrate-binding protein
MTLAAPVPRRRGRRALRRSGVAALVLLLVAVAGCTGGAPEVEEAVVIGVGSTVEQQVLAALTVVALTDAGLPTEVRPDLGDTVGLRRQALAGEVDVIWDYTGAAWALGLGQQNPPAEPLESYQRVREEDRDNGLTWLEPTTANATLALFVRAEALPPEPEPNGMDWLAGKLSVDQEALCVDEDFRRRPGGLAELATAYPMDLGRLEIIAAGEEEAIAAVAGGRCFAGLATATSGVASNAGLVPVEDELGVFPAFIVAPVAREGALGRHPEVADALVAVVERLDTATLAALNAEAERGVEPEELARRFLPVGVVVPAEG